MLYNNENYWLGFSLVTLCTCSEFEGDMWEVGDHIKCSHTHHREAKPVSILAGQLVEFL